MNELWANVLGYEGHYQVSNLGNVRSMDRKVRNPIHGEILRMGRPMKPFLNKGGYFMVDLRMCSKRKTISVHKLVATAFLGKAAYGKQVNHVNGKKSDNRVSNLEYCSPSENSHHAVNAGLRPIGEAWHTSKLTNEDVRKIKELLSCGLTQRKIGSIYGVHHSTIGSIKRKIWWKHHAALKI